MLSTGSCSLLYTFFPYERKALRHAVDSGFRSSRSRDLEISDWVMMFRACIPTRLCISLCAFKVVPDRATIQSKLLKLDSCDSVLL